MQNYFINFKNMPWEKPLIGVRQKVYKDGDTKIRLVEFSDKFVEDEWCTKNHVGYILEGGMKIDFHGELIPYEAGDGLFIPEGESHRHKAIIPKGEKVLLILFEKC